MLTEKLCIHERRANMRLNHRTGSRALFHCWLCSKIDVDVTVPDSSAPQPSHCKVDIGHVATHTERGLMSFKAQRNIFINISLDLAEYAEVRVCM